MKHAIVLTGKSTFLAIRLALEALGLYVFVVFYMPYLMRWLGI